MNEVINDHNHRIRLYGSWKELQVFARKLGTVIPGVSMGELEETIERAAKEEMQFNFTRYERMYLSREELLLLVNVGCQAEQFHFPMLKRHYEMAKQLYEAEQKH